MKKYRKFLAFALALVMLLGILAGCGPQNNGGGGDGDSENEPTTNAEREKVNIRFSQFGNSTDDAEGMAADPIKKAIEEAVNVTLEYDTGIEGYDDRLQTELMTGNGAELFPTWGDASKLQSWVEDELVTNIGEIINANPDRYPVLYKMINTAEWKAYNKLYTGDENACYAIYSIGARPYPAFSGIPVYNKAILDEVYGGKVPATLDEFVEFTTKCAEAGYTGWFPYNVKLTNWSEIDKTIAAPMGTSIQPAGGGSTGNPWDGFVLEGTLGTDETWKIGTTSDEAKEAVKLLAEMYKSGALHNGIGVIDDDSDATSQFVAGNIGSFGYGYGYYTQFYKIYLSWKDAHGGDSANYQDLLDDLVLGSTLSDDGNYATTYDQNSWMTAHYFIPASCEYADRVLDLVEFLASSEGQKLMFRGIEGLTYTEAADGTITYNIDEFVNINKSYGYPNPDRCRYMWFSYLFCGAEMMLDLENSDWWDTVTTPYDNTMEWAGEEAKAVYEYALEQATKSVPNSIVSLPSYYTFVALGSEFNDVRNNLKTITERYVSQMIGGQLDIETAWPDYVAEYEAAGVKDLEAALNEAVKTARETYGA